MTFHIDLRPNLNNQLAEAEWGQRDSEDLGGHFRLVDFIASPQFMVGTIVGAWFTVAAAFVVAFV